MFRKPCSLLLAAALCLLGAVPALALETDCDTPRGFAREDFSPEADLTGICILELPEAQIGTVMLDSRRIRPGDVLTAEQLSRMTFCPLRTETDRTARMGYLPVYEGGVADAAVMTISVRGREDQPPVAEDLAVETYKNLPATGRLQVTDPEGQSLTYTLVREPRRGSVTISGEGSFTYTPKKNKVGVDSFTFTARDPAGKVSREATVTITVLKSSDSRQYTDTQGRECRFAAEWMRRTGIFAGEELAGNSCFGPDKTLTRGEFTAMLTRALELEPEESLPTLYRDEIPGWLQPCLGAAVRAGLTAGLPEQEVFGAEETITGAEAAVMLGNALALKLPEAGSEPEGTVPVWAASALTALWENGVVLEGNAPLTRADAALALYRTVQLRDVSRFDG